MTQGDMSGGYGSDAGTQSDASSTNQRPVEQAADMASRRARSDLSTASTGQTSGAATHERQPSTPIDAGRQSDARSAHQIAMGPSADMASRATRSDLGNISTKQATDGSTTRPANMSHDTGKQGDASRIDQRVMGPGADMASRAVRSDLSSLSTPQTAEQEWNEHLGIHHHFLSDHSKHRDQQEKDQDAFGHYLQLRAAYEKQGIQNPAQYLDDNIKDISFFGFHTPGHRDLITHLQKAEMELKSKGINPEIASFWAFVPRTMNYQDKLSNHALGRAIDIDPKYNAHIIDKSVINVIAAVTGIDLGQEQKAPIMRQASQVFQQTFGDGWINQQKQQLEQLRSEGSPFPAAAKEIGRLQNLLHAVDHRRSEFEKYGQVGFFNLSQPLIDALISAGFKWGGDYKTQKDFMHFELLHQSQPHRY